MVSDIPDATDWPGVHRRIAWWRASPDESVDSNMRAPTPGSLDTATALADMLAGLGWPAPDYAVVDGDGGVSYEWLDSRDEAQMIELSAEDDGQVRAVRFVDGKLVQNEAVPADQMREIAARCREG